MDDMRESGLYDACTGLFYGCSCPDCENVVTRTMNTAYTKAVALPTVPAPSHTHENWTINATILFARAHPGCHVLYLHTKGVTNVSQSQRYWRHWMTDYMVGLWRVCVRLLASGYYKQGRAIMCVCVPSSECTVGVNYLRVPWAKIHYSGNYWWASSDYLATLSLVQPMDESDRMQAEMKLLENHISGRHVNLGTERWISNLYTWVPSLSTGLYSDRVDTTSFQEEHDYHIQNPQQTPLNFF